MLLTTLLKCCSTRRMSSSTVLTKQLSAKGSFVLMPYGVLGTRLMQAGHLDTVVAEPEGSIAVVDPAGLPFVQELGPSMAGAASGAIYSWLGIRNDAQFPPAVSAAVTADCLAKHHEYTLPDDSKAQCIHVVGPDFRGDEGSREDAVGKLATAYGNVLREFDASGAQTLRLLPISGGVFSGPWRGEMANMTMEALDAACTALPQEMADRVATRRLEMCLFMESEWSGFLEAGFAAGTPAAAV